MRYTSTTLKLYGYVMDNAFGSRVQIYRERAGLTQDDLAKALSVSQQTIAKWESGRAYPRPAAFAKLIAVLRIPPDEVLEAYGKSKGARSPSAAHPNLYGKYLEWAEQARPDTATGDAIPEAKENTYAPYASHQELLGSIGPLLNEHRTDAEWGKNIRWGTTRWQVDYMDKEVVAEFKYASTPNALKTFLDSHVREALWHLASLRAALRDNRSYLLIVLMPNGTRADYDEDDPMWDDLELHTNEMRLRRINAEAAPLDLTVMVANSPRQVLAMLNMHSPSQISN